MTRAPSGSPFAISSRVPFRGKAQEHTTASPRPVARRGGGDYLVVRAFVLPISDMSRRQVGLVQWRVVVHQRAYRLHADVVEALFYIDLNTGDPKNAEIAWRFLKTWKFCTRRLVVGTPRSRRRILGVLPRETECTVNFSAPCKSSCI